MAALLLLADSQLLFREELAPELHRKVQQDIPVPRQGVYLGAANGHQTEFHELACQGLENLFGQAVPLSLVTEANQLPDYSADLVVLAGGNVSQGWQWLNQAGVRSWLQTCYEQSEGFIMGVSAGAIHMARGCDPENLQSSEAEPVASVYLDWLPSFVAVHEEGFNWPSLTLAVCTKPQWQAIGIPMGSGVWVQQGEILGVGKPCFMLDEHCARHVIPPLNF